MFNARYIVRKQLESALESCHEIVYKHQSESEVARNKVKEAIEVVEKTCSDKDQLVTDLNKSNGNYGFFFKLNIYDLKKKYIVIKFCLF